MGTNCRNTTLETSVLYTMLPISPRHLLRIWHRPGIASLERAKVQHNDKRRLDESDQPPQEGEGGEGALLAGLLLSFQGNLQADLTA